MTRSEVSATERGNRWWVVLVVVAALLIMAAVLGVQWPGGFVVLGWLDLSGLFGAVALGLLALAYGLKFRNVDHPLGTHMRGRETSAAERRNRWWVGLVVVAALLIMAAVLGIRRPGGLLVLGWLDWPVLFGTVALCLLALACGLAVRDWVVRLVFVSVLVLLALGWAAFSAWLATWTDEDVGKVSKYWSPDGGKVLTVYQETHLAAPDPTYELRLRSGSGITAREWDLGCVNTELDSLDEVEWIGPDRVRVHLSTHGPIDIVLYRLTGRPSNKVSEGC
jgi:hypothetical protein